MVSVNAAHIFNTYCMLVDELRETTFIVTTLPFVLNLDLKCSWIGFVCS